MTQEEARLQQARNGTSNCVARARPIREFDCRSVCRNSPTTNKNFCTQTLSTFASYLVQQGRSAACDVIVSGGNFQLSIFY